MISFPLKRALFDAIVRGILQKGIIGGQYMTRILHGKSGYFPPEIKIYDLHHQVLEAWCSLREKLDFAPKVLTFDFHTDTLSASARNIPPPVPGDYSDPEKVKSAVEILHHDEHFDWALRSHTVSRALICAFSPQNGAYPCEDLKVCNFSAVRDVNDLFRDPDLYRPALEKVLTEEILAPVLGDFPADEVPYILDVDCDFFLTEKMLLSVENLFFARLVRSACLITLCRESDWIRLLRFPGERLSGEYIAQKLVQCFERICRT